MAETPAKKPERRMILKVPDSVIKKAQAAKLPSFVPDSCTARVCWIVEEWHAGRGRKGVRSRAGASEPENEGAE